MVRNGQKSSADRFRDKSRIWKILRLISGNLVIISVLVLGTARILDWYNPFMDFGGHVSFMHYVFAVDLAAFAAITAKQKKIF